MPREYCGRGFSPVYFTINCISFLFPSLSRIGQSGDLPAEYLASPLSKQQQKPPKKTEEEIKEEEELQLALAISQSESEKGNKKKTSDDADLELAIAMSKKEHEKSEKKISNAAPPTSVVTSSAVTGEWNSLRAEAPNL